MYSWRVVVDVPVPRTAGASRRVVTNRSWVPSISPCDSGHTVSRCKRLSDWAARGMPSLTGAARGYEPSGFKVRVQFGLDRVEDFAIERKGRPMRHARTSVFRASLFQISRAQRSVSRDRRGQDVTVIDSSASIFWWPH